MTPLSSILPAMAIALLVPACSTTPCDAASERMTACGLPADESRRPGAFELGGDSCTEVYGADVYECQERCILDATCEQLLEECTEADGGGCVSANKDLRVCLCECFDANGTTTCT